MRIISGSAGGLLLKTLSGLDTRPTSDKVKGAIFSILAEKTIGSRVFDLFSGSGSLGLEALSRGAESAILVDASREAMEIIKKNIAFTRLPAEAFCCDAKKFLLSCREKADLIFMDPPYFSTLSEECMKIIGEKQLLSDSGIIVVEKDAKEDFSENLFGFKFADRRIYGRTAVCFFVKEKK